MSHAQLSARDFATGKSSLEDLCCTEPHGAEPSDAEQQLDNYIACRQNVTQLRLGETGHELLFTQSLPTGPGKAAGAGQSRGL